MEEPALTVLPSNRTRKKGSWQFNPDLASSDHQNGVEDNEGARDSSTTTTCDTETKFHSPEKDLVDNETVSKSRTYSRVLSEPRVGFGSVSNSAKLKRTLSASEIKTRLVCPKGLLIPTEPPKSGESYRRRSNTEFFATLRMARRNNDWFRNDSQKNGNQACETSRKDKDLILLELESVKHERDLLVKENEKLRGELENRNKVIEHLVDYMNSSISTGMRDSSNSQKTEK